MGYVTPAIEHVAKKLARVPGVEQSFVCRDGAVDAIIAGGYNRRLREHLLNIGMRAMVPVRVFYRMEDGRAIGESQAIQEGLNDYYTPIKVAGFAGDPKAPPKPAEVAGDAYSNPDAIKATKDRDGYGQLKLQRLRANTRGRPVVGWKYGDHTVRKGSKVKFKKHACLQCGSGNTVDVRPGAVAKVASLSSRRPIAFLKIGRQNGVELPIHAVGHVYDVMLDATLESNQYSEAPMSSKLTPELKRLVMTVGFGRRPGDVDTKKNSAHFRGPTQPDLIGYQSVPEEDMLGPPESKAATKGKSRVTVKKGKVVDPTTKGARKAPVILGGDED